MTIEGFGQRPYRNPAFFPESGDEDTGKKALTEDWAAQANAFLNPPLPRRKPELKAQGTSGQTTTLESLPLPEVMREFGFD